MRRDPVSVVLSYLTSVKIFVIRIRRMDKYLVSPHVLGSVIFVNKSARLLVLKFILSREKTRYYRNATELGVPLNRAPRPYYQVSSL